MRQSYERPDNLDEALMLLGQSPRQVLAGGTDVYAALGDHNSLDNVLDVTAIPDLDRNMYEVSIEFYVVNQPTELVDLSIMLERLR